MYYSVQPSVWSQRFCPINLKDSGWKLPLPVWEGLPLSLELSDAHTELEAVSMRTSFTEHFSILFSGLQLSLLEGSSQYRFHFTHWSPAGLIQSDPGLNTLQMARRLGWDDERLHFRIRWCLLDPLLFTCKYVAAVRATTHRQTPHTQI